MRLHDRVFSRSLSLLGATLLLIAAHTVPLYYLLSLRVLSLGVVAGVLGLVMARHLGLLDPLCALVRGWSRKINK
jgi:hypothetical protein